MNFTVLNFILAQIEKRRRSHSSFYFQSNSVSTWELVPVSLLGGVHSRAGVHPCPRALGLAPVTALSFLIPKMGTAVLTRGASVQRVSEHARLLAQHPAPARTLDYALFAVGSEIIPPL